MIRNQRQHIEVGPAGNRRKTNHVTRACNTCRRKKSKCDGIRPVCKACTDSGHECTWTAEEDSRRPATKQYVESLKNTNKVQLERIAQLEGLLATHGISPDSAPNQPVAGSSGINLFNPPPATTNSQNHSPAGSWTSELPPDTYLNPTVDTGYESFSDPETAAENLSNAAARLVITDGDISVHGPSSLHFHRPSPITRTIPLDEVPDAPKHTLHISNDDGPPSRSHSRNPSFSHNRSRSQSQTRSPGHSRASSASPHGVTPPPQLPQFASSVSPPHLGQFATLSSPPQGQGGGASPFLDAPSPGSDATGHEGIDRVLSQGLKGAMSPNAFADDEEEDQYDWREMLPHDIDLSRTEHDTLLDTFFKFFASWCHRTVPDLFLRDMRRYLEGTRTLTINDSQQSSPPFQKPVTSGPKTAHYSPMLHNAMLAIALAYSDDPNLSSKSTRQRFIEQAKSTLELECSRPSVSCVQALAYIASYYSGEGEQTLGYLYFGMSIRMSQALGLSLDCSQWVRSGHISALDEIDRVWTFWVTYSLDKCWAFYVGRDLGLPTPLLKASQSQPPLLTPSESQSSVETVSSSTSTAFSFGTSVRSPGPGLDIHYPLVDHKADNAPWEWKSPVVVQGGVVISRRAGNATMQSNISSAFYQTCRLMVLATKVMNVIWKLPKGTGSESIAGIALEVDAWLEDLPDSMRITRPKSSQALPHVLMINMAHQWLQIILHRPFYRLTQNKGDPSIKRCDSGADKILQYLSAWRRLYELRYVPITVVQIAFVAGTTCLLKAIQSINMPEKRRSALDGVKEIVRALNEMGRTWSSATQSAQALKALLNEQISASERSPGPSRHPTVELQPPSLAPSRAQSMEMYDLNSGSNNPRQQGGLILGETENVFSEPTSDLQMPDSFLGGNTGYSAESPGSVHSQQFYNAAGMNVHNSGLDPMMQHGLGMNPSGLGIYEFPQFEHFMGSNDGRLRSGETFPNHPIFGTGPGAGVPGPSGGPTNQEAWFGFGFGQQQGSQQQQTYWG